jgi:hypothetical protein
VILIDSGSTHNFLYPSVVKKTQLPILSYNRIQVRVANGDSIQSEVQCSGVSLKVQGGNSNYRILHSNVRRL